MSKDPKSNYYDAGGIETIDVIKAKLTPEQYKGYLLGNAIKYQCRMMHKTPDSPARDAEKAANHSKWLSELLTSEPTMMDGIPVCTRCKLTVVRKLGDFCPSCSLITNGLSGNRDRCC